MIRKLIEIQNKQEFIDSILSYEFNCNNKLNSYDRYKKELSTLKSVDFILENFSDIKDQEEKKLLDLKKEIGSTLNRYDSEYENEIMHIFKDEKISEVDSMKLNNIIKIAFKESMGYIIKTERHLNSITTKNLRGLIELIEFLNNMDEEDYLGNLKKMKGYCNSEIIKEIENFEDREFLKDILNCEYSSINKRSLLMLNNKVKKYYDLKAEVNKLTLVYRIARGVDYVERQDSKINEVRVEYGDIVTWLKLYENIINTNEEIRFFEVFKFIYTIRQLIESHNSKEKLLRGLGGDYVGRYLLATRNDNNKRDTKVFEISTRNINREVINIEKLRKSKINHEIFESMVKPKFEKYYYTKLVRREQDQYNKEENLEGFKNMRFYRFGLVSYKINYTNYTDETLNKIINLDSWMEVLDKLDKKIQKTRDNYTKTIYIELNKIFGSVIFNLKDIIECEEIEEYVSILSKINVLSQLKISTNYTSLRRVTSPLKLNKSICEIQKVLEKMDILEDEEVEAIKRLIDELKITLENEEELNDTSRKMRDEIKLKLTGLINKYIVKE